MNKLVASIILNTFITCFFVSIGRSQDIFQFNKDLGKGMNLGNMFEAPTEGAWGYVLNEEDLVKIKGLGFGHVRLPVRWDTPARTNPNPPFTINPEFIARIKSVVDAAHKHGLTIIINMHHHDDLYENPQAIKPRFLAQWAQIASYFKDYPNTLVFEVLNEPHGNLLPDVWNPLFEEALQVIRITNPNRPVLMGTAEYGGLSGLSKLKVPNDKNVIVSIHYYNPFNFTHQGAEWATNANEWLGTKWLDLQIERDAMASEFAALIQFSKDKNVPIHMGEFGSYYKADMDSRVRWTTYLARYFEELGFSWAYWEYSAGFGIYDPSTKTFRQRLVDALTKNPMPTATQVNLVPVYCTNFSGGVDGWAVYNNGGASSTISAKDGNMILDIKKLGTQNWHVQLVKSNLKLEKGKLYKLSVEVKSENDNSGVYYAGKNGNPYNSYSGYPSFQSSADYKTFSTVFTMTSDTDPGARIAIDLGNKIGTTTFRMIKIEEVNYSFTSVTKHNLFDDITLYPNPTKALVNISGLEVGDKVSIRDSQGRLAKQLTTDATNIQLDTSSLAKGQYFVQIVRGTEAYSKLVFIVY